MLASRLPQAISTNGEDGIVGRTIVALIVLDGLTGNASDREGLSATVTRGVSELQVDLLHYVCQLWGASPGRLPAAYRLMVKFRWHGA